MTQQTNGFNFNRIFGFPFKDPKLFEKMLLGFLFSALQIFIPIFPTIFLMGYFYRLMDRDINGDGELELPEWKDLGGMFKDGFKIFAVNLIYSLPTILIALAVILLNLVPIILIIVFAAQGNTERMAAVWAVFLTLTLISVILSIVLVVLQVLVSFLLYPVFGHVVAEGKFSAGFKFKAWWPIFIKNFVGYLIIVGMGFALGIAAGFISQILAMTVIGIILFPMVTFFTQIFTYAMIADVYIAGRQLAADAQEALPDASLSDEGEEEESDES